MFYDGLVDYDSSNTTVVMFGLGDQGGYPETFLDAMGILYRRFLEQGEWRYRVLAHRGLQFYGVPCPRRRSILRTST